MKARLPIIGLVATGKDANRKPRSITKTVEVIKDAAASLGAGFLDLSSRSLTSNTSISKQLIQSYHGWVYANVSALAEEISKAEFALHKVVFVKGDPQFVEITQHPLLDLLDRPNPFTTTSQLLFQVEAHIELAGDTFLLLDKPTNPTSLFILPPDKITVLPGDIKNGYNVLGYRYIDTIEGSNIDVTYDPELVIHVKTPNPQNPYRGKSTVEAGASTIDSDVMAEEFLKRFFLNNATPGMTLSTDQRLSKDDITRITADLDGRFRGASKAFKTLLLGGGLKPVVVQHSNKEMEYIALENLLRDKIMALFKNTKSSLGIVEDVNRANAEASLLGWKQNVIVPKLNRIVDTLNEFLIPRFGSNLVLGYENPVPEDNADDVMVVQQLFSSATNPMMTVNEARELVDLEPLDGDEWNTIKERPVPTPFVNPNDPNATPKSLRHINIRKHFRRTGLYDDIAAHRKLYAEARKLAEDIIKKRPKRKDDTPEPRKYRHLTNDQALQYWSKQVKLSEMVEKKFVDRLNKFISHLEEKAISTLHDQKNAKGVKKWIKKADDTEDGEPFDFNNEVAAGIDIFAPLLAEIAQLAGNEAYQLVAREAVFVPSKDLRTLIADRVELFTKSFVSTDQDRLIDIIQAGIEGNQSIPQIAASIRSQFGDFRRNQVNAIARTEVASASTKGALDAYQQSGAVAGKQWLTAEDDSVDDECQQYDGQIIDLDSSFYESDSEFADGDPPLHVNCRCQLLPVIGDVVPSQVAAINDLKTSMAEKDAYIAELEGLAGVDE